MKLRNNLRPNKSRNQTIFLVEIKYYLVGITVASLLLSLFHQSVVQAYNAQESARYAMRWLPYYGTARTGCSFETCVLDPARHPELIKYFGDTDYHPYPAIDFGMPYNTPIRAAQDGVVVMSDIDTENPSTYPRRPDRFIVLQHASGPLSTYKHLSRSFVNVGDRVVLGQVIAQLGNNRTENVHLHYDAQATVPDFNLYPNQRTLGRLSYRYAGAIRSIGARVPKGSTITSSGWSTAPYVVNTELQLRTAMRNINNSSAQGPFIIRLRSNIELTQTLHYKRNDLLIIEGGKVLQSPANKRILTASGTGQVEFINVRLTQRGNHTMPGSLIYSPQAQIVLNGSVLIGQSPKVASNLPLRRF